MSGASFDSQFGETGAEGFVVRLDGSLGAILSATFVGGSEGITCAHWRTTR